MKRDILRFTMMKAFIVLALVLCICYTSSYHAVVFAASASPSSSKASKSKETKTIPLPSQAAIFSQSFYVSIMTQAYGTFNGSLRMHSSFNFPEHIHGELVLLGDAVLTEGEHAPHTQKVLPHFSRPRELLDDRLSLLPPSSAEHKTNSNERPSLLAFDIELQNAYSSHGDVKVYYLPADLTRLQQVREAIEDGEWQPTVRTSFDLSTLPSVFTESLLSNVAGLARVASNKFTIHLTEDINNDSPLHGSSKTHNVSVNNEAEGDYTLRFFSEHEFTIDFHLPLGDNGTMERVWMHAYTPPSKQLYNRAEAQTFMQRHGFTIFAAVGVFLNVLLGIFGHRFQASAQSSSSSSATATATAAKKKA